MYIDTLGLVLKTIDYSDRYMLVKIYTREFGNVTYQIARSSTRTSSVKRLLFQPLTVLRLSVKHKINRDIHKIKEASVEDVFTSIPNNPMKMSLVFFLAEFLSKVLKEPNKDVHLFDFVRNSLFVLDKSTAQVGNYHLVFLFRLSYFLGISPSFRTYELNSFFDMQEGIFTMKKPIYSDYLSPKDSKVVFLLGRFTYNNMQCLLLTREERNTILEQILNYYRIHALLSSEFKTLEILKELY